MFRIALTGVKEGLGGDEFSRYGGAEMMCIMKCVDVQEISVEVGVLPIDLFDRSFLSLLFAEAFPCCVAFPVDAVVLCVENKVNFL